MYEICFPRDGQHLVRMRFKCDRIIIENGLIVLFRRQLNGDFTMGGDSTDDEGIIRNLVVVTLAPGEILRSIP